MRKVFDLDPELLEALRQFSSDSNVPLDDLAREAFELLLHKHCRPKNLKQALAMSLRRFARNDNDGCADRQAT